MQVQKFFHLDCNPVIPECGYQCSRCIQEIYSVLGSMEGVMDVSTGNRGKISGIVVRYDSVTTTDDNLLKEFSRLPSFYRGHFVPKALDA